MEENYVTNLPSPRRVIEGLRDTGYTFDTAICDIIDNSITAKATNISVSIFLDPVSGDLSPTIMIADNGTGMTKDKLIEAMRYGSEATDKVDKLGKFGLGLKTASTAFCRDLVVITKTSDSNLVKAEWDLDLVFKQNEWNLLLPSVTLKDEKYFNSIVHNQSGTLVLWHRVDRLFAKKYVSKSAAEM